MENLSLSEMLITHEQTAWSHKQEVRSNLHIQHCRHVEREVQRLRSCETLNSEVSDSH